MGNVVLIGFMGCGKSSVAVKLSYRLKRQMTDTDRLIEKNRENRFGKFLNRTEKKRSGRWRHRRFRN